jgi:hypothetical protein
MLKLLPEKFQISHFLSIILHPLMIPAIATMALMLRPDLYSIVLPNNMKFWFISVVIVFTLLIPLAGVLILLKFNAVNSIEMNDRHERTLPLIISSTSFMVLLFSLKSTGIPPVFLYILYSATFALLAGLLINLFYKISLHTLGWGAIAAAFTGVSFKLGVPLLAFIVVAVLLSGLAGYARLKQNAHNPAQVYLGYVAGISVIILISFLG